MKKILKWIMFAIPLLLIAGIAFIVGGSYLEHRELVEQEKEARRIFYTGCRALYSP